MKYGEFKINQSEGVILCSDIALGGFFLPKGHKVTQEDIALFKGFDIYSIFGVLFEDGDVDFKVAQQQIAAQICGSGLGFANDADGICRIVAGYDGVFVADDIRLDKFNGFNDKVVLNVIKPYTAVKSGEVVAELEVVAPLIEEKDVDDIIFRLSGNENLLSVSKIKEKKAVLLYPHLLNDEAENKHFTSVVMKLVTNLADVGLVFEREVSSRYNKDAVADSLFDAYALGADVVFVLSPLKSVGRHDVIASAVSAAVDEIVNFSVPVVSASELILAQKDETKVIVIPFAYDTIDSSETDRLIKRAVFSEYLSEAMFVRKHAGHIFKGIAVDEKMQKRLIMPKGQSAADKADIGIVVLAAGQGRRAGLNKLMTEGKNGEPLFLKAVYAAIASKARPVFVVTGYRHEELEEWLEKLDVNVLYNPSYTTGIRTSIAMGLKSVPSSCDGAILLPADMPGVEASDLNKLITKFDKTADKQLCVLTHKGVKSNPVLWSKSLYDKADIVPENAAMRAVFVEHADYTKAIEIKDAKKLRDVNFPNDVEEFKQQ